MLSRKPDPDISSWELDSAIRIIKRAICGARSWQFREEYIDRGLFDPYYLIRIRMPEREKGCDTRDQKVFKSSRPELSYVCRTAQGGKNYWHDIDSDRLIKRLDRFKALYDKNKYQPPGYRGDLIEPKDEHEIFEKKRFIYEIASPFRQITGIGPDMYAIGPGAVCGTVYDMNGSPLDGVAVELVRGDAVLRRKTRDRGLFWFSRASSGKHHLRVKDRACLIQVLRRDEFGNIKGWLADQHGYPIEYADLNFRAPDGEVFPAVTDSTGKFSTGPLPAFPVTGTPLSKYPYIMQVPGFMFSVSKSIVVKDAVVGGVLRNNDGVPIANETVLLKQSGTKVAETKTDGKGNFRFFELQGDRYSIEVPGQKIYLSRTQSGGVEGKEPAGLVNETRIELVAEGKVVATERLSTSGQFGFESLAPGRYSLRSGE